MKLSLQKSQNGLIRYLLIFIFRFFTRLKSIDSPPVKCLTTKKTHKTDLTRQKDCDKKTASLEVPVDTYYEGFQSLLNDTEN